MRPIRERYQGIPGVIFATSDIQVSFLQKMMSRWKGVIFYPIDFLIVFIHLISHAKSASAVAR